MKKRKLEAPVTLFAAIEAEQHEALRLIAFQERRSLADVVREALDRYIAITARAPARAARPSGAPKERRLGRRRTR